MLNVEIIWEYIIAVLLAVAGGLARLLNKKSKTKMQLSLIFAELFISGFSGLMVLLLARASGVSGDWLGLICGMAGWSGPKILDMIAKPAGKAIGVDVDGSINKSNG